MQFIRGSFGIDFYLYFFRLKANNQYLNHHTRPTSDLP
ncbi:hypothetical protein VRRI112168_18680 [Vreelandella rituensis]